MDRADELERIEAEFCVIQAQRGDEGSFRRLVEIYEPRLLYFVRRLVRNADAALDVMQEVWVSVFRRLKSLRSPGAFKTWVYQIAHDRAIDLIRRERRESELYAGVEMESEVTCDEEVFDNAELVHRALEKISLAHREVLTLRFLEDLEVAQIAEIVRCSLGTAKSRLHYAKQALRRQVEELSHEPA